MGKYAVLITLAAALGMSLLAAQGMRTDLDTSESQATRQKQVLARQIAHSAFDMGLSTAKRGIGLCCTSRSGVYGNGPGEYRLDVLDSGTRTQGKKNWRYVKLSATGTYSETTYEISATVRQSFNADFDAITAGKSVDFTVNGPGCDTCISGHDEAGGKSRFGISLPPSGNPKAVCDAFRKGAGGKGPPGTVPPGTVGSGGSSPVIGAGKKDCSVATRGKKENTDAMERVQTIERSIKESNKVTKYPEDILPRDEEGVLYVEKGTVVLSSGWKGIVYVNEDAKVKIPGNHSIEGALLLESGSNFRLAGGGNQPGKNNVQYNTDYVLGALDVLPNLGGPIQVRDRSGGFSGWSESEQGDE